MLVFPAFDFDHEAAVHPRLLQSRSLKAELEGLYYFLFVHPNGSSE
jgi:hypothetical protein